MTRTVFSLAVFVFLACLVVVVFAAGEMTATPAASPATAPTAIKALTHAEWLDGALRQITALKPGITRREFEKTFVIDGGLNGTTNQRYCFREGPTIKVSADFQTPEGSKRIFDDPDAKLVKVSKPYLETPFYD